MNWRITLSEPDLGQEEIDAVTNVLKSKWLTMGAVTADFEKRFAEKMGVKYAFAVNNCTAALHLANVALDITTGHEVICPALTFVASANSTVYTGATVIFADVISEHDLTIDPNDVEQKITPRTKAITVVHYAGFSCHMDELLSIAQKHNLAIIEDCAHAPFGRYASSDGSTPFLGSIGDIGCFSFFSNKNMTTGEGGMITTNNDVLAEKIKLLRSHGMTALTFDRHKGHASGYDVVLHGYNYRPDEIKSAIGICQLNKIDSFNQKRREIFSWYTELLHDIDNVIIPFKNRNLEGVACHIMPIILKNNLETVRNNLRRAYIQTSKHYDLIPSFSAFQESVFKTKISLINNIITLPMYPGLSRNDVEYICQIVRSAS